MGAPAIKANSEVAKLLEKTLGRNFSELDKADGDKDGQIFMGGLYNDETLRGRVIDYRGFSNYHCEWAYFVDNGDGKVGPGDIFLHGDGFYGLKNGWDYENLNFRFAKLFEPRKVQQKSRSEAKNGADLTPEAGKVLKTVESLKDKPFKDVSAVLKEVCTK